MPIVTSVASINAKPAAPTGLTASADGGYTNISLSWSHDNRDNLKGFEVYRSDDGATGWSFLGTSTLNDYGNGVLYYQDTGLTAGNTYYYRVRAYNDAGFGRWSNVASDTVFQLSDAGSPYLHLDADLDVYSDAGSTPAGDGNNVQEWHDQSGNGYNVTQTTASAKPVYQTSEINGHNVIRFASGDILKASTAGDWTFLHNGAAFTVFVVWKTTNAEPNTYYAILDTTNTTSAASTGLSLRYDDRATSSRYHQMWVEIVKGVGGNPECTTSTENETVRGGRWHITAIHRASSSGNVYLENDGHWGGDAYGVADGAPSASAPASALTVGGNGNNSGNLVGDIAEIIIYSSDLTDANRQAVTQYLGEKYAQPEYLFFEPASMIIEASANVTYDYAWAGGITRAPNGNLVATYTLGETHGTTNPAEYVYVIISEDDGATWGSEITVWDKTNDGGGTEVYQSMGLTVVNNVIWMKCGKRTNWTLIDDGLAYFKSYDNGLTWQGPTQITGASGTNWDLGDAGEIVELANGRLLFPYYYNLSAESSSYWHTAIMSSDNGGVTWSALADISESSKHAEPGIVQLPDGTLVAWIRDDDPTTPRVVRYSTSDDNGATWSAVAYGMTGYSPMCPILTQDEKIIAGFVRHDSSFYYPDIPFGITTQLADSLTTMQHGHNLEVSPNYISAGGIYGWMYQDVDGAINVFYSVDATEDTETDVMFTRAPRGN